jgi:hypothetical protein
MGPYQVVPLITVVVSLLPVTAWSQSATSGAIAGVVRDASGGVLPGVTVEAASPALIEKSRTAITDREGQYKIVELRPGAYTVAFTLAGFRMVKREGIELVTGFTATVNADMQVGSLEETITVSGASPVVDTQNVRTQSVYSRETLDALPTLKSLQSYAALTLGATFASAADQDVGGSRGEFPGSGAFIVHNSRTNDNRMTLDGMPFSSLIGEIAASNKGQFINQLAVEETTIQTSGGSAEYQTGGVYMNVVPKSGGNTFSTTLAVNGTGSGLQSNNVSDELRARGVATPPNVKKIYDGGGAVGGPIRTNRLWFYTAHRWWGTQNTVPGSYFSASQHTLFYTPDLSRPAYTDLPHRDSMVRLTWQASPKNKMTVSESVQKATMFWEIDRPFRAPEAAILQEYPNSVTQITWSYPATNKLLLEAGGTILRAEQNNFRMEGVRSNDIPVTELSTGLNYNARAAIPAMNTTDAGVGQRRDQANQRLSMSYVTGSHALKVGLYAMEGWGFNHTEVNETAYGPVGFSFRLGMPAGITQWASPFDVTYRLMPDLGLYAQDQWTVKQLTLNLGLRYDHVREYAPAQRQQGNVFVGARDFPELDNTPNFNDISPRVGAAYDLFGNGRTAIKGTAGRYVGAEAAALVLANAPAARIATGATRTWTDSNSNYVPECDLIDPLANGECGRLSNINLGRSVPSTNYADEVLRGWGRRRYMWQSAIALQQELRAGMALNIGYHHTWHGNFTVTANQVLAPGDFDSYCVTAPKNGLLGDASGKQICGFYDVTSQKFGQISNLVQPAANFGKQYDRYDGVDIALNARYGRGGLLTGGVSTGKTVSDNCAVVKGNPQIGLSTAGATASLTNEEFCHVVLPWSAQTQVKLAGSYPLPWWGLQVSGTYQNLPGIPIFANYVATNAEIAPSLGRNLSSCPTTTEACTATATVAIMVPNSKFEDRFGQFDFRVAKTLRIGRARLQGMFDVYNLFNTSAVLAESFTYGANWLRPSGVLSARFVKFGGQLDF